MNIQMIPGKHVPLGSKIAQISNRLSEEANSVASVDSDSNVVRSI